MKKQGSIIGWWSGGITSATACKLAQEKFKGDMRFIFIDTLGNEDEDTYRFKTDCENWYQQEIETIQSIEFHSIQDVWKKTNSLNISKGAVCSDRLKMRVRLKWEKTNQFEHQIYGYSIDEPLRAKSMELNHPHTNPIFPLIDEQITKADCIKMLNNAGLDIPRAYKWGFKNNNCLGTGCVQGGIGYWQMMRKMFPEKFHNMAHLEHFLTEKKGSPITMLRHFKNGIREPLFLVKNAYYPHLSDLSSKKPTRIQPLFECNGFCGINDLEQRSATEQEINFEIDVDLGLL